MPVSENKKIQVFKKFLYWFFLKDLLCLLKSPKEFIRYKKYRIKYLNPHSVVCLGICPVQN